MAVSQPNMLLWKLTLDGFKFFSFDKADAAHDFNAINAYFEEQKVRIWYQTGSTYRYDSSREAYGKMLEEQCKRAARPDSEIYVTGVPVTQAGVDRYKSLMYYHTNQMLNGMLRAEKEGYHAVVIGNSYDIGFDEAREMLNIPVVAIAHSSFHTATMIGELFAVLTCEYHIAERYRQMIRRYGMENKFLGNYIYPIPEIELIRGVKEPAAVMEKFKAVAEKAVADGASVLISVPAPIYGLFYQTGGLTDINGATLLDPVAVSIKMAEFLVDLKKLGIDISRKLGVHGSPGKELLQKTFKIYASAFRIEY